MDLIVFELVAFELGFRTSPDGGELRLCSCRVPRPSERAHPPFALRNAFLRITRPYLPFAGRKHDVIHLGISRSRGVGGTALPNLVVLQLKVCHPTSAAVAPASFHSDAHAAHAPVRRTQRIDHSLC